MMMGQVLMWLLLYTSCTYFCFSPTSSAAFRHL